MGLMGIFLVYPLFLHHPLVDPDEGLHASIAQEMVERGDWVTPKFIGEPFFDKPVLFSWTQALSFWLLGMNETASRLPGMVFGMLGVVSTGIVGWRLFGRMVGAVAALLYASMLIPLALSQVASHDVALVPWVNLAILLFWEADRAPTARRRWTITLGTGIVLGLACLTKGLVGVALVGVSYGAYLLATRRLSVAACLRGVAALGVALLIASAWYVAMEVRNPGYLYYFFVERHLLGYTTGSQRHGSKPFWYYLPILLAGGIPWIGYLPAGLRHWWPRPAQPAASESNGGMALVLSWILISTLFLSAASSKLVTYIWPVFPALAILLAIVWVLWIEGRLAQRAQRWFAATFWSSCLIGPAVPPVCLLLAQHQYHLTFSWAVWAAGIAAGLTSWLPFGFWRVRRYGEALVVGAASLAAQFLVLAPVIGSPVAEQYSARDLAQYLNQRGQIPSRVVILEGRVGSLLFYLDPKLRAGLHPDQLQGLPAEELAEAIICEPDALIVLSETQVPRVQRRVDLSGIEHEHVGRYRLYSPAQLRAIQTRIAARHIPLGDPVKGSLQNPHGSLRATRKPTVSRR
jgi:4-amino-4-deoxy-L-arabinose transferase-like glycosyltransferase